MRVLRTIGNIVIFPVRLLILLAQLILGAVIGLTSWILYAAAGVLLIADVIGLATGLDKPTFILVLAISALLFLLPTIGSRILRALTYINEKLKL